VAYDNALPFLPILNAGFATFERSADGADAPQDTNLEVHYQ
jgi:hypothetical protein